MIRNRLSKLEQLLGDAIANCAACLRVPAIVQMPGEPSPRVETVRCPRCGNKRRPLVVRVVTPMTRGMCT